MAGFLLGEARGEGRSLPRGIRLRRGTGDDEAPTFDTMRRAMGFEMNWGHHAAMRHHLRQSPNASFWIAEEAHRFSRPKVIGYARSVVRDRVWSLTEFFLLPEHHRRGIGGALLAHALDDGNRAGADTRLVLASQHPAADSLYIRKAGCAPRIPMLLLSGPLSHLQVPEAAAWKIEERLPASDTPFSLTSAISLNAARMGEGQPLFAEPLVRTPFVQNALDALDRAIVGYARPTEHDFWEAVMGGPEGASRLFRNRSGELVGYAYMGSHSSGPALAATPEALPSLMAHVAGIAHRQNRQNLAEGFALTGDQYCAVAGTNEVTLRWLLDCGWLIVFQYLFMSSRPLGQPDRYVCHNPLYVL